MTQNGQPAAPIVAITLGDPAGIGPEVVVKALAANDDLRRAACRPLLIGSYAVAELSANRFAGGLPLVGLNSREQLAAHQWDGNTVPVWDVDVPGAPDVPYGAPSIPGGVVSITSIELAATLALEGRHTGHLHRAHQQGGRPSGRIPGHWPPGGIGAHGRTSRRSRPCLSRTGLRAVHLTTHVPFRDAYKYVTKDRILARLRLTDREFRKWGVAEPRIAVAALNPHGGDSGLLGSEEIEEIAPAVEKAVAEGIRADGPLPADSVFLRGASGEFDAVIALYHDQGHISVKMHDFHGSVSVNLGLPFVRTSVDHGTAYDIAGTGTAEAVSMSAAIRTAALLCTGRGLETAKVEQEAHESPAWVY